MAQQDEAVISQELTYWPPRLLGPKTNVVVSINEMLKEPEAQGDQGW